MRIQRFTPPGGVDDSHGDTTFFEKWSTYLSADFDDSIHSAQSFLSAHAGGRPQFYNPVTNGLSDTDRVDPVTWNGFPKRFVTAAGSDYQKAEPTPPPNGVARLQDEYLEWFSVRDNNGKITKIQFTCEGYDYWDFLASVNPARVVELYQQYISPLITKADLFPGNSYNRLNRWNTASGAMHLTHSANALGAEVKLASDATVRRTSNGSEPATSSALIRCAQYGNEARNSDPKIGFAVNGLAQRGYMITLADPVGLVMVEFNDAGLTLPDGSPVENAFQILRGKQGAAVRVEFRLPDSAVAKGYTVSDVLIGGVPVKFGGQLAELITMGLSAASCRAGSVSNPLQPCGPIPEPVTAGPALAFVLSDLKMAPHPRYSRKSQ